jgi:hypothetical protein
VCAPAERVGAVELLQRALQAGRIVQREMAGGRGVSGVGMDGGGREAGGQTGRAAGEERR